MSKDLNRRDFLRNSIIASAGVVSALSLEEKILLAGPKKRPSVPIPEGAVKGLQMGKLGKLKVSRLMAGGNLISGYAHSRNLVYVTSLLRHYFTDEKIIETLQICEENGINTAVLRCDDHVVGILKKYWKMGGKLQWIAQCKPRVNDLTSNVKKAIDNGAVAAFSHGGVGDTFFNKGHIDLLGKVVSLIKENGLVAGIGGHLLDVVEAAEEQGLEPDFYFKTLNSADYKSETPKETIAYMRNIKKPWIAFKVLGAGVIRPTEGFKYAFDNGADFMTVGMYDFQVKEDVVVAKDAIAKASGRERPWAG